MFVSSPWIVSIITVIICFTGHALCVKLLGDKFPTAFITPAFYSFAVLLLWAIYCVERPHIEGGFGAMMHLSVLLPLVIAGFTIGLTDFFVVRSINQGAEISLAMPVFMGGSIVMITLLSFLVLSEALMIWKALGILMTISGLFLMFKPSA